MSSGGRIPWYCILLGEAPGFKIDHDGGQEPEFEGTLLLMRKIFALPCCLAFVTAFVLSPLQHVHPDGDSHDHAPLVHSHLYAHHHDHSDHPHVDKPGEQEIEGADEDQASSLDTFTLVPTPNFSPVVPSRIAAIIPRPAETRASFELVEERGHDPPASRNSSPRPPPA